MDYSQKTTKERVLLTPETAKEFLTHNYERNRSVRPANVARLAEIIKTGEWNDKLSFVYDPIIFTDRGEMINGQHRCLAVIAANKTVNVWVQFGIHDPDMEIFRNLDSGCVRKSADYIDGANANSCAAAAKIYVALTKGSAPLLSAIQGKKVATKHDSVDVSRIETINAYNADPDYFQNLHRLGRSIGMLWRKNAGAFRTALMIIDVVGRGACIERFVEEFGSATSTNKTIVACKNYMTKCFCDRNFSSNTKWTIGCILAAYDYFISGTDATCFNKTNAYLSRYDKYLEQARSQKGE